MVVGSEESGFVITVTFLKILRREKVSRGWTAKDGRTGVWGHVGTSRIVEVLRDNISHLIINSKLL